jgi:xanthine dehydrogenase accessory factor
MKNIYLEIPLNIPDISDIVLATVTNTEGSTPQKPGSSAIFSKKGLIAGTVGGGILEGKVQMIAIGSLLSKRPALHLFRLDNSLPDAEDALCGGKISVLIDSILSEHIQAFEALRKSVEDRIPGILVTLVRKSGENILMINRYWLTQSDRDLVPGELLPYIEPELNNLISCSDSYDFREVKLPEKGNEPSRLLFLEPVIPPPRLIIAGAGHIGKALSQIGSMLDFEITVIDDRPEFANPENIPSANHIVTEDIGKSLSGIEKGSDTYIVIVTRGHKDDGSALRACIGSDATYIGMIGSKNKVALMQREFIENGWATREQWNRIFAPVGIDIKSKTVEEIAVSIAAQLVKVKNNKGIR